MERQRQQDIKNRGCKSNKKVVKARLEVERLKLNFFIADLSRKKAEWASLESLSCVKIRNDSSP